MILADIESRAATLLNRLLASDGGSIGSDLSAARALHDDRLIEPVRAGHWIVTDAGVSWLVRHRGACP